MLEVNCTEGGGRFEGSLSRDSFRGSFYDCDPPAERCILVLTEDDRNDIMDRALTGFLQNW